MHTYMILSTLIITLALGTLGAILASFVGVVAERVHTGATWINDRSRCDACARTLTVRDLLPVLSWLLARGRCRTCGARIPVRHVVVEALTALSFISAYSIVGLSVSLLFIYAAMLVLLFIVLYDIRHTIVSMRAVLIFILLSLLYRLFVTPESIGLSLLVAGCAGSVFLLFHLLSKGRAMGLGDSPVVLGLSLLVGPMAVVPGVLFSFWIGAIYGIGVLVSTPKGHRMGIEVPFVPFLALGFLLAYFSGWNPLPLF